MPKRRRESLNRVCFWLPYPWRVRLLEVLSRDGRPQGEFIRSAVTQAIERSEQKKI